MTIGLTTNEQIDKLTNCECVLEDVIYFEFLPEKRFAEIVIDDYLENHKREFEEKLKKKKTEEIKIISKSNLKYP